MGLIESNGFRERRIMFSNHQIKCLCLGIVLCFLGWKTAFAVSGNATMTAVADGSDYDYTITLKNNGLTGNIETFWFGWLPGVDLLTSSPTVTKTPMNWTNYVESGYYGGYSIEFYDTGTSSGLAPGQSSSEFQFTSPDSPSVLQGLDPVYGYYTETYSYVYQGQAEASSSNIITSIPISVVPEPPTFLLAVLGVLIFGGRAKLLTPTCIFQKKISQAPQF
jgi:hypothetical protein